MLPEAVIALEFFGGIASARWTERAEGDLHAVGSSPDGSSLSGRRPQPVRNAAGWQRFLRGREVAWAKQVHGRSVVVVSDAGDTSQEADGLVTRDKGLALMVRTADCAPIALATPEGIVGVAHGGWRGLVDGVLLSTADAMRRLGATTVVAALGPTIRPCCYEFGADALARVAEVLGPNVRAEDAKGRPALDLPEAVRAAAARAGVELVFESALCTGCQAERFWSHRVRKDRERQGVLAWLN